MSASNFPIHGELDFSVQEQILIIEGSGPANVELMIDFRNRVPEYREQVMHSPWACLVVLSGTPLISPEGRQILFESIKQALANNLVATSVVFTETEFTNIAMKFWQEIFTEANAKYSFHTNKADAISWLNSQLPST